MWESFYLLAYKVAFELVMQRGFDQLEAKIMQECLVNQESKSTMPYIFTKSGQVLIGKVGLLAKGVSNSGVVWLGKDWPVTMCIGTKPSLLGSMVKECISLIIS